MIKYNIKNNKRRAEIMKPKKGFRPWQAIIIGFVLGITACLIFLFWNKISPKGTFRFANSRGMDGGIWNNCCSSVCCD